MINIEDQYFKRAMIFTLLSEECRMDVKANPKKAWELAAKFCDEHDGREHLRLLENYFQLDRQTALELLGKIYEID